MELILVLFGIYVGLMTDITVKRDNCIKQEICTIKPKEIGYEVVKEEKEIEKNEKVIE